MTAAASLADLVTSVVGQTFQAHPLSLIKGTAESSAGDSGQPGPWLSRTKSFTKAHSREGRSLMKQGRTVLAIAAAVLINWLSREAIAQGNSQGELRRAAEPIPGSYIVVLKNSRAQAPELREAALALAAAHGGHAWGLLTHGIHGFGFRGSEQAALALTHNPNVAWVEEDGLVHPTLREESATGLLFPGPGPHGDTCLSNQSGGITCTFASINPPAVTRCTPQTINWQCDDAFWHLDRIDQDHPTVATDRSYTYKNDGSSVRVYILDYGVRGTHVELAGKVEVGANMMVDLDLLDNPEVTNCSSPNELCEQVYALDSWPANNPCGGVGMGANVSHGTAVASVVAGTHVGVAREASIVPVKVGNCNGFISKLAVARGLDWVIADAAAHSTQRAVVSMSLRLRLDDPAYTQSVMCETDLDLDHDGRIDYDVEDYTNCIGAIENNVVAVLMQNIPVVTSAGNDRHDVSNDAISRLGQGGNYGPPAYKTITVGGTMYAYDTIHATYSDSYWTCNNVRDNNPGSGFSCSDNLGSNFGSAVSLWAPAWYVKVADGTTTDGYRQPGMVSSGTSFAAPAVAGAIARILQQNPLFTVDQVWGKLSGDSDAHAGGNPDFDEGTVENHRLLYLGPND